MKTINVLPIEEIFYIKTIYFSVEYFGRLYTGKVVYKRNLSEHYVMDESKRSEIDKMFYYYPETCYPKDIIDEIILQGITKKYPNAKVHTQLMLCDVERDDIKNELSHYKKVDFQINIQPRVDDINALLKTGKTTWRVFIKSLPLYLTNSDETELFRNEGSFIYYDLDKEDELIELEPTLLNEVTVF